MSNPGWPPFPYGHPELFMPLVPPPDFNTIHQPPHLPWPSHPLELVPNRAIPDVQMDPIAPSLLPKRAPRKYTKAKRKPAKPYSRPPVLADVSINTNHPIPTYLSPHLTFEIKGLKGELLPVPAGCTLELCDLFYLTPPSFELLPPDLHIPLNQYTKPRYPGTEIKQSQSAFESYTCRVCKSSFEGKNSRSVARRHLQDRHGVPLSVQSKRSRWQSEPNRPQSNEEKRDRNLKSKRNWARQTRLQARLEKEHASFLSCFGQRGLVMPCGLQLIAPDFRKDPTLEIDEGYYIDGTSSIGNRSIPVELLKGVQAIHGVEHQVKSDWTTDILGSDGLQTEQETATGGDDEWQPEKKKAATKGKGKAKLKAKRNTRNSKKKTASASAPLLSTSALKEVPEMFVRTPISHARTGWDEIEQEAEKQGHFAQVWASHWGGQTSVEKQSEQEGVNQYETGAPGAYQVSSSDPIEPMVADRPPQQWVSDSSVNEVWYPELESYVGTEGGCSWPTFDDVSNAVPALGRPNNVNEHDEEAEAAEVLLDLHSTPLRPRSNDERTNPLEVPSPLPSVMPQPGSNTAPISAPQFNFTPRPPTFRSKSSLQPFDRGRPVAPTRSLSFTANNLEDPFALHNTPTPYRLLPNSLPNHQQHRPISPSPTVSRLKHKIAPSPSPLQLQPLRPRPENHMINPYYTPLRGNPIPMHIPSSVWRDSVVCSPNADVAASLGLGLAPAAVITTPSGAPERRRKRARFHDGDEVEEKA